MFTFSFLDFEKLFEIGSDIVESSSQDAGFVGVREAEVVVFRKPGELPAQVAGGDGLALVQGFLEPQAQQFVYGVALERERGLVSGETVQYAVDTRLHVAVARERHGESGKIR